MDALTREIVFLVIDAAVTACFLSYFAILILRNPADEPDPGSDRQDDELGGRDRLLRLSLQTRSNGARRPSDELALLANGTGEQQSQEKLKLM